jgi:hypothetical protein
MRIYLLLPEEAAALEASSRSEECAAIGYPDFLERASHALGMILPDSQLEELESLASRIVDTFLWSVVWEIPEDVKAEMRGLLPLELSSRMNLYTGVADSARVA